MAENMPERMRAHWVREEWFGEGQTGPEPIVMNKRHVGYFSTDATGTEFIRADLVDDLVKALEEARDYLTALEGNLIANDADMMIDDCDPPTAIADRLTAALTRIKGDVR